MSEPRLIAIERLRVTERVQPDRPARCAVEVLAEVTLEIFVHQQNLLFFRKQLAESQDEEKRRQLTKLLAEEAAKIQDSQRSEKPAGEQSLPSMPTEQAAKQAKV